MKGIGILSLSLVIETLSLTSIKSTSAESTIETSVSSIESTLSAIETSLTSIETSLASIETLISLPTIESLVSLSTIEPLVLVAPVLFKLFFHLFGKLLLHSEFFF